MTGIARAPATRRRLFYAVAAGSLITAVSLGVRSTFGLYLSPISDALGTPRAVFALTVAIQNIVWGLGQPVAGALADRYGSGRVLAIGSAVYAGGMALMSRAGSSGALYLSGGFVVGGGLAAASFAVVLAAIGRIAPPNHRSLALGIATAMGSAGQFVLVPVAQAWLAALGWEQTVALMGVVAFTMVLVVRPLRGNAAATMTAEALAAPVYLRDELRRASQSRSYLLLNSAFFVCGFHVTFIATHLPAYVEDLGIAASVGAWALALIGLFNIVGSFTAGALGARFSKSKLLSIIYAARAVVIAAFVVTPLSPTTTVAFGAAIGLLWLATVPLTSGIVMAQFGPAHAGTLFGIVFLSHQVGAFFGAWFGGRLADAAGTYVPVWWIAAGLGVFAAVVHLFINEGPAAPVEPRTARRWRLAPTVGASLLVLGAVGGLFLSVNQPANAEEVPVFVCVLRPASAG
ncbi:MAG: MFS transporter [Acidimicrobiia bacterium]|nr:MFS transporter [Acidimicrobiia bacterium]